MLLLTSFYNLIILVMYLFMQFLRYNIPFFHSLSQPTIDQGQITGGILVSRYEPNTPIMTDIDTVLQKNMQTLNSHISIKNGQIDTRQ